MADPDKLRQAAIDAINGVKTPDSSAMMITLQHLIQQGVLTPEQLQASLVDSNAFDSILTNPAFQGAQQQALAQLQNIGQSGGLTPEDKAQIQDITSSLNEVEKGREDAIQMNAKERGVGGSGLEMAARMNEEQGGANRASAAGTNVAALAQQRALQAIQGAGSLGGAMESQQYGEQANKAQAQNAIDLANAQMTNNANLYNTQSANAAQAQNLAEKQRVADTNIGLTNTQEQYNKQLPETQFQNNLAKANGVANIYNQWAQQAAAKQGQKTGFNNALIGGALQTGGAILGGAMAGPPGAVAGSTIAGQYNPNAPQYENQLPGYNKGGEVCSYKAGGVVPGLPKVPGDSPKNDTVHAMLSPGELVVPRSKTPSLLHEFGTNLKAKPTVKSFKQAPNIGHEEVATVLRALSSLKGGK